MQTLQEIRKTAARSFMAMGAGTATILLIAIGWLSLRVGAQAFSHIVLIIGTATFAIIGVVIFFARRFNAICAAKMVDTKPTVKANLVDS